jgi:hypothetical protein
MSKQEQFIESIAPHAQEIQRKYGVPASIAIAQAALESGWGEKVKGNNLFGVKAGRSWHGATIEMATHEYLNGVRTNVTDRFRAYATTRESMENYGKLLSTSGLYAEVVTADSAHEAADALQAAGYATDPKYASKLKAIIDANNLTRFDDASYRGYTEGARFQQTRERLANQRQTNPEPWAEFMKSFGELIAGIFSAITAMLGISDDTPAPPAPTPPASRVAAVGNVPARPRG